MKTLLRNPKFWLVAVLLGLLAMRAGCPPGVRRPAVPPLQQPGGHGQSGGGQR